MPKLQLALEQDQIHGFSYSFTTALLNRLSSLHSETALFTKSQNGYPDRATSLTENLCHYLSSQIPHCKWSTVTHVGISNAAWGEKGKVLEEKLYEEISKVLKEARDFLSTFEIKK